MKVGDEILVKAKVIDFDEPYGAELKVEIIGFKIEEEKSRNQNSRVRFWINPLNQPVVLIEKKK